MRKRTSLLSNSGIQLNHLDTKLELKPRTIKEDKHGYNDSIFIIKSDRVGKLIIL